MSRMMGMNRSAGGQIIFNDESGGGGGDNLPDDQNLGGGGDNELDSGLGDEGDDDLSVFGELFDSGDGDDDLLNDGDDDDDSEQKLDADGKPIKSKTPGAGDDPFAEQNENLKKEIATMLTKLTIPQDVFPEDFDPTDRKQLSESLTKLQRHTAVQTMQMAFKPMQLALSQFATDMRKEMSTALRDVSKKRTLEATLADSVPEYNDPNLKGMVTTLYQQARANKIKHADAIVKVKKAISAMGLSGKGGRQNQPDPSEGGYRSGRDALDMFAPLNPPRQQQRRG